MKRLNQPTTIEKSSNNSNELKVTQRMFAIIARESWDHTTDGSMHLMRYLIASPPILRKLYFYYMAGVKWITSVIQIKQDIQSQVFRKPPLYFPPGAQPVSPVPSAVRKLPCSSCFMYYAPIRDSVGNRYSSF